MSEDQADDGVRWLALLLRQGLKLIIAGIERRYGLGESELRRMIGEEMAALRVHVAQRK